MIGSDKYKEELFNLPKAEAALKRINNDLRGLKKKLSYFDTSHMQWLKEQTKDKYDEFLKPTLKGNLPELPLNDPNDPLLAPFLEWLNLEQEYNHLKKQIENLEFLKEEVLEWSDSGSDHLNRQIEKLEFLKEEELEWSGSGSKIKKSYKWIQEQELPELFEMMVDEFVHSETTIEQFTTIFTWQPIESITPIRWHDDNASELLYFIIRLEETSNIEEKKRTDYIKMKACFVKPNGKPFNANFKELKQNIYINLSQEKQKAIDKLISNFM